MFRLWHAVGANEPRAGVCAWVQQSSHPERAKIDDGMLRLCLDYGHEALEPDDEPADVIAAMLLIVDTINSDREKWPENFGMTEAEWAEADRRDAEARRVREATQVRP